MIIGEWIQFDIRFDSQDDSIYCPVKLQLTLPIKLFTQYILIPFFSIVPNKKQNSNLDGPI